MSCCTIKNFVLVHGLGVWFHMIIRKKNVLYKLYSNFFSLNIIKKSNCVTDKPLLSLREISVF